jgi:hypothetical protein
VCGLAVRRLSARLEVPFEYFAIEQDIQAQLREFYQLSIELRALREAQDRAVDDAINTSLGNGQLG